MCLSNKGNKVWYSINICHCNHCDPFDNCCPLFAYCSITVIYLVVFNKKSKVNEVRKMLKGNLLLVIKNIFRRFSSLLWLFSRLLWVSSRKTICCEMTGNPFYHGSPFNHFWSTQLFFEIKDDMKPFLRKHTFDPLWNWSWIVLKLTFDPVRTNEGGSPLRFRAIHGHLIKWPLD